MCDDQWSTNDADVVCRQLGIGRALSVKTNGYYGFGTGPVWLSDVACLGSETKLENCYHGGWEAQTCSHEEDAGVDCGTCTSLLITYPFCR